MTEEVILFRLDVPESALADLRERLRRTRWPDEETVEDCSQGVPWATCARCAGTGPRSTTGGPPSGA